MRKLTLAALALLANLMSPSAALADDRLDGQTVASFTWRLGFGGGQPLDPALGLTLGYRGSDPVSRRLLALDLSGAGASARLAGVPLFEARHLRAQIDGAPTAEPAAKPWYTQQWLLWGAGGLAVLALTGGASVEICHDCESHDGEGEGTGMNVGSVASVNNDEICGTQGTDGVPDTCADTPSGCTPGGNACVNCDDSTVTQGCDGWTARPVAIAIVAVRDTEPAWLSDGTGHMGDLLAR